jgi:ADP-ribose pyrophosphatase YjhB (NUDIX family)
VNFIPDDLHTQIEHSVPILCVDFVAARRGGLGDEVGLILRESPFGQEWCRLGSRVRHGETVSDAIRRHARDTLGVGIDLGPDPQPVWVYQWFPDQHRPPTGLITGHGPRKQAIGLSFFVHLASEEFHPQDEALDFAYFQIAALPQPLWPGCEYLIRQRMSPSSLGRSDNGRSQHPHRHARATIRPTA